MLVLDIFVFLFSLFVFFLSVKNLLAGRINAASMYYPVFFLFFPFGLLLDFLFGSPSYYLIIPGYLVDRVGVETELIYSLFVFFASLISLFYIRFGRVDNNITFDVSGRKLYFLKFILILFIFLGPISIFFTSQPWLYFSYAAVRDFQGTYIYEQHSVVAGLTLLSAFSIIAYRFIDAKKFGVKAFLLLFILILDIYFNSKRLISFFVILFFVLDYIRFGQGRVYPKIFLMTAVCFVGFFYIGYEKVDYERSQAESYAANRIDWGRDANMKFVINDVLVKNESIVDYPGQSFVFTFLAFLPREFFENYFGLNKPYAYSQYLTGKVVTGYQGPALLGWGLTTSIFDELISNFRWFGLLLCFLYLIFFFEIIDRAKSFSKKFFFLLIMALTTTLQPEPYIVFFYFFLYFVFVDFFRFVFKKF